MRTLITVTLLFVSVAIFAQVKPQPNSWFFVNPQRFDANVTLGDGTGADSLKGNTGTVVDFRFNNNWRFYNPTDSVEIQATQTNLLGLGDKGIGIIQRNGGGQGNAMIISKDALPLGGKGAALYRLEFSTGSSVQITARRSNSLGLEANMQVNTSFGANEVVVADSFITINVMDEAAGIGVDNRDLSHPHINFSLYNPDSSLTYGLELHHHDDNFIFETTQGGYEFNTTGDIVITSPITPSLTRLLSIGADGKVDTALGNSGWTIDDAAVSNMSAGTGSLPDLTTGIANMAAGIEAGKGLTEANLCFFYGYDLTLSTPTSGSSIGIGSQFTIGSGSVAITNGGGATFGNDAVCIGCVDAANGSVAIGSGGSSAASQAQDVRSIALGAGAIVASGDSNSIAFGYDALTTEPNQLFITDSISQITTAADLIILRNGLPTDSTGLPSGALWSNSGVVEIKP